MKHIRLITALAAIAAASVLLSACKQSEPSISFEQIASSNSYSTLLASYGTVACTYDHYNLKDGADYQLKSLYIKTESGASVSKQQKDGIFEYLYSGNEYLYSPKGLTTVINYKTTAEDLLTKNLSSDYHFNTYGNAFTKSKGSDGKTTFAMQAKASEATIEEFGEWGLKEGDTLAAVYTLGENMRRENTVFYIITPDSQKKKILECKYTYGENLQLDSGFTSLVDLSPKSNIAILDVAGNAENYKIPSGSYLKLVSNDSQINFYSDVEHLKAFIFTEKATGDIQLYAGGPGTEKVPFVLADVKAVNTVTALVKKYGSYKVVSDTWNGNDKYIRTSVEYKDDGNFISIIKNDPLLVTYFYKKTKYVFMDNRQYVALDYTPTYDASNASYRSYLYSDFLLDYYPFTVASCTKTGDVITAVIDINFNENGKYLTFYVSKGDKVRITYVLNSELAIQKRTDMLISKGTEKMLAEKVNTYKSDFELPAFIYNFTETTDRANVTFYRNGEVYTTISVPKGSHIFTYEDIEVYSDAELKTIYDPVNEVNSDTNLYIVERQK